MFWRKPPKWVVIREGNNVHVIPYRDLIGHPPSDSCACSPVVEPVEKDGGGYNWLVSHNAADGRT